jgi:hypothetical protein
MPCTLLMILLSSKGQLLMVFYFSSSAVGTDVMKQKSHVVSLIELSLDPARSPAPVQAQVVVLICNVVEYLHSKHWKVVAPYGQHAIRVVQSENRFLCFLFFIFSQLFVMEIIIKNLKNV